MKMNEVPPAGLESGDALAALVVRFTEAERQLYPLALVDARHLSSARSASSDCSEIAFLERARSWGR